MLVAFASNEFAIASLKTISNDGFWKNSLMACSVLTFMVLN